jgi:ABC-type uncharacterized transport system involved in gliding motility auxiliary subunit
VSRVWTIARRDVKALFDQPTGYVLLVVFLAVNAFLFFRNAYLSNVATLRPMLDFLPWIFLFFVPAVAMRSLAEDTRSGLLEIVLAQPVSEAELLLGKYLGVVIVLLAALLSTLLIPLGLALGSALPWGPVVAQYVGAALLAAAFAGIGVWASSLGKSQITAFILSVAVMFVLILVGLDPLLVGLPPVLGAVAARLGVLSHFESVGRGVLDLRDVLYFLSVAALFLALAYAVLMRRRLAPATQATRQLRLGTVLLCGVVIVLNLAGGEIGGRLDLSPGRAYTLSSATKAIVRSLPDLVTIKLYASKELPSQFALDKRDVDDLLHDLRSASHGRLRVLETDPASDTAAAEDARSLGIVPVQFNVLGQSELQVKEGFFGLVVQYAGKHETIPFIRQTDDLEYRLASTIRDMTRRSKATVALLVDSAAGSYAGLRRQLEESYNVETPNLADSGATLRGVAALVVASAQDSAGPAERSAVSSYLSGGGAALVLVSGMVVTPRLPFAHPRKIGWNAVLSPYGVQIRPDLVYDLRANQLVSASSNFGPILRPYPYFLRGRSTRASPINADLGEVDLPWSSSVDTTASTSSIAVPLIVTSDAAGASSGEAMIDPSQPFSTTNLERHVLGVQVSPRGGSKGPRLVVVGDALLASDVMAQRSPGNLLFALNAVDWLAQDVALISIRAKNRLPPPLVFSSSGLRDAVKYGNVAALPILVAAYGVLRLLKRRRLAATPYARRETTA